jgi:hypothetical protein
MENVPAAVGVPVIAPVEAFSVRPAGSVPTTVNVYGEAPPLTVMAGLLNGTPTSPVPTAEQVTVGGDTIVNGQVVEARTPLASETWTVNVPAAVGVPVMAPFDGFSVRPIGSVPTTVYVYGATPPLTVIAPLLNGTPTSPEVTAAQVTVGTPTIVYGHVVAATTPFASVTCSVKVPAAVAMPVIAPVCAFKISPDGNVPTTVYVYGATPPVTEGPGLLNGTPTSPEVTAEHVTVGAGTTV